MAEVTKGLHRDVTVRQTAFPENPAGTGSSARGRVPIVGESSEPIDKLASLVPDLFFDAIARVLPGGVILSYVVFVRRPPPLVEAYDKHPAWWLLAGGYIVGLMLTSISLPTFDFIWGLVFRNDELPWDRGKLFGKMDRVYIVNSQMGNRMWKNYAEMVHCEALFMGFLGIGAWEIATRPIWRVLVLWLAVLTTIGLALWVRVFLVRARERHLPDALDVAATAAATAAMGTAPARVTGSEG
jgi:hypothetical protein